MNRDHDTALVSRLSVPRKRGDEPIGAAALSFVGGCSPQTRG